MQSEQWDEEGVSKQTEKFVCPFFQSMNEQSIKEFFDWKDIGFYLANYWLREIRYRPKGGSIATPIWQEADYAYDSDEF